MTSFNLPKDWKSSTLSSVIDLISGQHIQVSDCNTDGRGVPYLTGPSDFENGSIKSTRFTEAPQVCCKAGDILLTVKGSGTGTTAIADTDYCISRQLMAVRPRNADSIFIRFVLESHTDTYNKVSAGLIPGIARGDVLNTRLSIPPLIEQQKIGQLLLTSSEAIEKTERLIATKLRRNDDLSNRLLFGHARFGARNTKTTRPLHWFSAPSDWQVVEIGKIAHEVSALNGSDSDLPVLSCTKYDGLVDSLTYFDKQMFSYDTSKYKVVRHGQFAYATNHIEEGSIGYQNLVPAGLVSPIYTVFQTDTQKIDDGYFYKLLKTEKLRQIFAANTNASVDRRGSLRWKEFARIHIPLPPIEEQREISAILDEAKREISLLQAEVAALKTQKRGLMQKLLTGQWRVKVEDQEVA